MPSPAGALLVGLLVLFLAACIAAQSANADFGFQQATLTFTEENGSPTTQAGSHPFALTASIVFNTTTSGGQVVPDGNLRGLRIVLPKGLIGIPALLSRCSHSQLLRNRCPAATAVGTIEILSQLEAETSVPALVQAPVYNLDPLHGSGAELGIYAIAGGLEVPMTIQLGLTSEAPYRFFASLTNATQSFPIFGYQLVLWGNPGAPAHDPYRGSCANSVAVGTEIFEPLSAGSCPLSHDPRVPLLSLPASCAPGSASFEATAWSTLQRGVASVQVPPLLGCADLPFSPALSAALTSKNGNAPTGLKLRFDEENEGLLATDQLASAQLSSAGLALPKGMAINPPFAIGRGVCTQQQLAAQKALSASGEGCPQDSKIGTAELTTPLFTNPISGEAFVAEPDDPATPAPGAENPFDSRFALYLVFKDAERGISVVQPISIEPDPETGRVRATLADLPQLPIEQLDLDLDSGPHAPLATPSICAAHSLDYSLQPSSEGPPLTGSHSFSIADNCPTRFEPLLSSQLSSRSAGSPTSLDLELSTTSHEASPASIKLRLPRGLSAALGSVPICPEAAATTGVCTADSRLGSVHLAVGGGPEPLQIPSAPGADAPVYLAGPYQGAPYSLLIKLPASAGPFDLGTVVLRAPIAIDPTTAQATIRLEDIPQILAGVPLRYREVRLVLDRPGFIRTPTSCAPGEITGTATTSDGESAPLAAPFQAADCAALAFKPQVSLRFFGPAHRGAHPSIETVLKAAKGEASVARAVITLPPTELLDNAHIRGICTTARFSSGQCPAGSIYGHAKAWTPLLDRPLEGPVYLRSSSNRLPDLVASLNGQIHLDLTAHVSSVHGRLRYTFAALPDAPLSKLALTMRGGRKGLLVNTGGLCAGKLHAGVSLLAHNGKRRDPEPAIRTDCGKQGKQAQKHPSARQ